jgi:hypothetical protein
MEKGLYESENMKKRTATKHVFPGDKATNKWLDTQKKGTKNTYATHWKLFLEWTGMTGDQILQSRKEDKDATWEKLLPYYAWRARSSVKVFSVLAFG